MEEQIEDIPKISKFNSSQAILEHIAFLKYKASEQFRKGDLEAWFFEWKSIKFQVAGKLVKEDIEYLEKIESKLSLLFGVKKRSAAGNKAVTKLIEKYLTFIQVKIEEWGMGLAYQRDETIFT